MGSEEAIVSVETRENDLSNSVPFCVTVLLVDGDSTCLAIISKMLLKLGYKVITAQLGSDALCILRNKMNKVDLVLSEACLPDMDQYEVLESIEETSGLPVVLMSADFDENAMLGGLCKGASLYFVKPLCMDNLKNIWQFTLINGRRKKTAAGQRCSILELPPDSSSDEDLKLEVPVPTDEQLQTDCDEEIKGPEEMEIEGKEDSSALAVAKKPELIWSNELREKILKAVKILGIDGAHQSKILQHMNALGIEEGISSHVQVCAALLSLKLKQDEIQNTRSKDFTTEALLSLPILKCLMKAYQPPFGGEEEYMNGGTAVMDVGNPCSENFAAVTIPVQEELQQQHDFMLPVLSQPSETSIKLDENYTFEAERGEFNEFSTVEKGTTQFFHDQKVLCQDATRLMESMVI